MPALQVRLSEWEYAICKERAKEKGVSMSEWVRWRLFDGEQPVPGPRRPKPRPKPPRTPVNSPDSIQGPGRKKPEVEEVSDLPAFDELALEPIGELVEATIEYVQREQWDSPVKVLEGVPLEPIAEEQEPRMEEEPPIAPLPGPEQPRHQFKRHPSCTTDKCYRFGNACTLCRMANAISF